jgi:heme exporter protein C
MALRAAFDDRDKADRVSAILGVVGVINVPIIHYSVIWWNTLHQGPSISDLDDPSIDPSMLWPFLLTMFGFMFFFFWLLLDRLRTEIVIREQGARWLTDLVAGGKA